MGFIFKNVQWYARLVVHSYSVSFVFHTFVLKSKNTQFCFIELFYYLPKLLKVHGFMVSSTRVTVYDDLESMCKEVVVSYFKCLSCVALL
jgi:hypothetical protein